MRTPHRRHPRELFLSDDDGAVSVEYVFTLLAAAALAALLLGLIKGEALTSHLRDLVERAFTVP